MTAPQVRPRAAALARLHDLGGRYPLVGFAAAGLLLGAGLLPFSPQGSRWFLAMVTLLGGLPLVWSTLKQLARREYHVDLIATLAIGGSALLGEFLAGAVVVLMQASGDALEDYGLRRARRSLDNLLRRAPGVATRQEGEQFVAVPAAALRLGDVILVRPGDIIAADGVVAEGYGSVDEAALTGEPVPLP